MPAEPSVVPPQHGHLWLVRIPSILAGVRYADMFDWLATDYQALPLGIYRQSSNKTTTTHGIAQSSATLRKRIVAKTLLRRIMDGEDEDGASTEDDDTLDGNSFTANTPPPMSGANNNETAQDASDDAHRHCYVYCNPTPKTKMRAGDRVYVVALQKPIFRQSNGA